MSKILQPLKSSIGSAAEGADKFYLREAIIRKIKNKLALGENLLISAPRRIGKTSILKYLRDNPEKDQIIKYLIVQSVTSTEEFYKKLFNELIKDKDIFSGTDAFLKRSTASLRSYISRVTGFKVDGVELGKEESICYKDSLFNLVEELANHEKKIVLFIDEFPDALNNIFESDPQQATLFLRQHRELRENHSNSNLQFIYTGSTGLKNVVRKTGELHLINNLPEIRIPPLSIVEARELIQRLVLGKQLLNEGFEIPNTAIDYLLNRINWLLPYYIQIIVEELFDTFEDDMMPVDNNSIERVLSELVKSNSRHADYFENWKSRLKSTFSHSEQKLALDTLNHISKEGEISYAAFNDISEKHEVEDHRYVLKVLQHDGYIQSAEDEKKFGFNSVLLKEWWYINVAT